MNRQEIRELIEANEKFKPEVRAAFYRIIDNTDISLLCTAQLTEYLEKIEELEKKRKAAEYSYQQISRAFALMESKIKTFESELENRLDKIGLMIKKQQEYKELKLDERATAALEMQRIWFETSGYDNPSLNDVLKREIIRTSSFAVYAYLSGKVSAGETIETFFGKDDQLQENAKVRRI